MDEWHETQVRVRYAETDAQGIVHNSNYFIWFEVGRSELCRSRGFSYKQVEEQQDAVMVVAEAYCRYKSPAYYEDVLTIRTKVGEVRSRSIAFVYEVYREADDIVLAEGETLHVVTDREQKVRVLPDLFRDLLNVDLERSFPPNQAPH